MKRISIDADINVTTQTAKIDISPPTADNIHFVAYSNEKRAKLLPTVVKCIIGRTSNASGVKIV